MSNKVTPSPFISRTHFVKLELHTHWTQCPTPHLLASWSQAWDGLLTLSPVSLRHLRGFHPLQKPDDSHMTASYFVSVSSLHPPLWVMEGLALRPQGNSHMFIRQNIARTQWSLPRSWARTRYGHGLAKSRLGESILHCTEPIMLFCQLRGCLCVPFQSRLVF